MDIMKDVRGMKEMHMTIEDWLALAQKDGWQAVYDRRDELNYQALVVRERIRVGAEKARARRAKGKGRRTNNLRGLIELYRMEEAVLTCARACIQEPDMDEGRTAWIQARIRVFEQQNAQIRELIAIWKWREGQLDA